MTIIKKAYAQINAADFGVQDRLGNITDFKTGFIWAINLLRYLGWLGVIFGVAYTFFIIIYKLYTAEDSSSAFEIIAGAFKRNFLIILLGLILASAGFIVEVVSGFFGQSGRFVIPY